MFALHRRGAAWAHASRMRSSAAREVSGVAPGGRKARAGSGERPLEKPPQRIRPRRG
ncbi:hypothetical protein J2789_003074 [Variovorax paradoxus]|uniref:hypothetical protein n=1 Tax=Variovorax atrisoli TaxID=3394203 RepID=UPI0028556107|nr:hypothetical protein [Variovorax paradoxus]MDR6520389.1 hypothetical protein [Variovorax paradoxus]